jgi:hypothetical protein
MFRDRDRLDALERVANLIAGAGTATKGVGHEKAYVGFCSGLLGRDAVDVRSG